MKYEVTLFRRRIETDTATLIVESETPLDEDNLDLDLLCEAADFWEYCKCLAPDIIDINGMEECDSEESALPASEVLKASALKITCSEDGCPLCGTSQQFVPVSEYILTSLPFPAWWAEKEKGAGI